MNTPSTPLISKYKVYCSSISNRKTDQIFVQLHVNWLLKFPMCVNEVGFVLPQIANGNIFISRIQFVFILF